MKHKPAIVIVAFNRKRSLERLLGGIGNASYTENNIQLVISIDKSEHNNDVLELANTFEWKHGPKLVVYQKENLGLRKHILKCGAYALTYGAAIILEDDLYVSPNFYNYAIAALKFSENKSYISGISLYNHQFNVHSRSHFSSIIDGYDNWYLQMASSWGQAWTKTQWQRFLDWYEKQNLLESQTMLPENVIRWSEKSWLKYFIAYLVETDSYFLYPRNSYSTNFSDTGTHVSKDSTIYQVPLEFGKYHSYHFSTLQESNSIYDVFYENRKLHLYCDVPENSLVTDLYGKKPMINGTRYLLTEMVLPFKVIKKYARSLKPHDANIIADIVGDDLFLYDRKTFAVRSHQFNAYRKIMYNIKSLNLKEAQVVFFQLIKEGISRRLKRLGL